MKRIDEELLKIAEKLYGIRLRIGQGAFFQQSLEQQKNIKESLRSASFLTDALQDNIRFCEKLHEAEMEEGDEEHDNLG